MSLVIIYPSDSGIQVLHPKVGRLPITEIARKDVPAGVPFRIIPATDLPESANYREAWTADFTNPDGEGIGAEAWWAEKTAAPVENNE